MWIIFSSVKVIFISKMCVVYRRRVSFLLHRSEKKVWIKTVRHFVSFYYERKKKKKYQRNSWCVYFVDRRVYIQLDVWIELQMIVFVNFAICWISKGILRFDFDFDYSILNSFEYFYYEFEKINWPELNLHGAIKNLLLDSYVLIEDIYSLKSIVTCGHLNDEKKIKTHDLNHEIHKFFIIAFARYKLKSKFNACNVYFDRII